MDDDIQLPTADDLRKVVTTNPVMNPGERAYTSPSRDKLISLWDEFLKVVETGEHVYDWLSKHDIPVRIPYDLREQSAPHAESYARARARRADHWHGRAEKMIGSLVDAATPAINPQAAHAALKAIEYANKSLNPGVYGDIQHHRHSLAADPAEMTAVELLAEYERRTVLRAKGYQVGGQAQIVDASYAQVEGQADKPEAGPTQDVVSEPVDNERDKPSR